MEAALRLKNALASAATVALACATYAYSPFNQALLTRYYGPAGHEFAGIDFFKTAATIYAGLVAAWFLLQSSPGTSKSLRFCRVLLAFAKAPVRIFRDGLAPVDRLAVLSTLLKGFFGPMMTMFLMSHCMAAWVNGTAILQMAPMGFDFRDLFDRFGFWFLMQAILFIDVLLFTVGYLVESPRLRNEIRSVDPTVVGWAAALLCYPPFNLLTSKVLGAPVSDFPQFDNPDVHIAMNLALLTLMALYASASVALGLKASNLTHRGIVSRGPYSIVRHPAYVSKNLAWWIGSTPLVIAEAHKSLTAALIAVASVLAWSMLYVLRALTEEDHLRKVDGEYAEYAAKVRYRFLPGIV